MYSAFLSTALVAASQPLGDHSSEFTARRKPCSRSPPTVARWRTRPGSFRRVLSCRGTASVRGPAVRHSGPYRQQNAARVDAAAGLRRPVHRRGWWVLPRLLRFGFQSPLRVQPDPLSRGPAISRHTPFLSGCWWRASSSFSLRFAGRASGRRGWRPWIRSTARRIPPCWSPGVVLAVAGGVARRVAGQEDMAASWRIGIAPDERTDLVTQGLFRFCRNPIYLGLQVALWPPSAACSPVTSPAGC